MVSVRVALSLIVSVILSAALNAQPFAPNVDGTIDCNALQPNGALLIGGTFSNVNATAYRGIARLTSSGGLDSTFVAGTGVSGGTAVVYAVAIQSDGKILIAGDFTSYAGTSRNRIARLHSNGSLDTTFDPGAGPGAAIYRLAIQSDGKIVVGGIFSGYGGRSYLARLNTDGSLDSTYMTSGGPDAPVYALVLQSDGKAVIGGSFWYVSGAWRYGVARMNTDGTLDTSFNAGNGPNNWVLAVAVQSDGKIVIGGRFTNVNSITRNGIARLESTGGLDTGFSSSPGVQAASNMQVSTLALQPDGRILLGGFFDTIDALPRLNIGRVNSSGAVDTSFSPGSGANNAVTSFAVQPDLRIIATGSFTQYNTQARYRALRVEPSGSLEGPMPRVERGVVIGNGGVDVVAGTSGGTATALVYTLRNTGSLALSVYSATVQKNVNCTASVTSQPATSIPAGSVTTFSVDVTPTLANFWSCTLTIHTNATPAIYAVFIQGNSQAPNDAFAPSVSGGSVDAVLVQPDQKILIGGNFNYVNYAPRIRLARMGVDGTLDGSFDSGSGADGTVLAMALQPDGKVVVGGMFTSIGSSNRARIARLAADGSLDATFNPGSGANAPVRCVAVQTDGKILIGGDFTNFNGSSRNRVARLNADGSLDAGFDPGSGANSTVGALIVQPNGQILISGTFDTFNGTSHQRIARLNSDGSADSTFVAATDAAVSALALQSNGQVVIGGAFSTVNSAASSNLARLNADGTLDAAFNPSVNGWVRCVAIDASDRILVGGDFSIVNGSARQRVARLTTSGTVDSSFDPGVGPSDNVWGLRLHANGKVLISGAFNSVAGATRVYCARLHADGALDDKATTLSRGAGALVAGGTDTVTGTTAGAQATLSYTLANLSSLNLTVVSAQLSGATNCSAAVSLTPAAFVAPGGTTTFDVQLTPVSAGTWSIVLQVLNSGNPGVFAVSIQGSAVAPPSPVIQIRQTGIAIANGGSDGLGTTGPTAFDRVYEIRNIGTAALNLTATPVVSFVGQSNCAVTLSVAPSATIVAGGSTNFTINIAPLSTGSYSFSFSIANSDASNNPFVIAVSGSTGSAGGGGGSGNPSTGGGGGGGCTASDHCALGWGSLVAVLLAMRRRRRLN